jgi:hypothetical protein
LKKSKKRYDKGLREIDRQPKHTHSKELYPFDRKETKAYSKRKKKRKKKKKETKKKEKKEKKQIKC